MADTGTPTAAAAATATAAATPAEQPAQVQAQPQPPPQPQAQAQASEAKEMVQASEVKPPSHAQRFVKNLALRHGATELCDVTLVANSVEFPCHRVVLSCNSEYFARMFEGSFAESKQSRVELRGVTE